MAKRDKDYENRMAGYIAAYNLAKTKGIEALGKDLKIRNVLKVDIGVPEKLMREQFEYLSANVYANTMTSVAWTLHDVFGFGKERIHKFKKAFDKVVKDSYDLDYLGEHYVRLEDFALELNKKYDLGIDYMRVAVSQELLDEDREAYRMCKIDRVLQELRENGYEDAAFFIEKKLY